MWLGLRFAIELFIFRRVFPFWASRISAPLAAYVSVLLPPPALRTFPVKRKARETGDDREARAINAK